MEAAAEESDEIKSVKTDPVRVARFTWYQSPGKKRLFVLVGLWYTGNPETDEVELLEVYERIPILHSRAKFEQLLADKELITL